MQIIRVQYFDKPIEEEMWNDRYIIIEITASGIIYLLYIYKKTTHLKLIKESEWDPGFNLYKMKNLTKHPKNLMSKLGLPQFFLPISLTFKKIYLN